MTTSMRERRFPTAACLLCTLVAACAPGCDRKSDKPAAREALENRRGDVMAKMDRLAEEAARETSFVVVLMSAGDRPADAALALAAETKITREEADRLLTQVPVTVAESLTEAEANSLRDALVAAGAQADVASSAPDTPAR